MSDAIESHEHLFLAFESAWMSGPPSIEAFASEVPGAARGPVVRELVLIDLEHRLRRGESIGLSQYTQTFPEITAEIGDYERIVLEELRLQSRFGKSLTLADVQQRCTDTALASRIWDTLRNDQPCDAAIASPFWVGHRMGSYELVELIGRGAFSVVYRATDHRLSRDVAVKILNFAAATNEHLQARLELESQIQASLAHPGIAPVHDVGMHLGQQYIVSRFVHGRTLEVLLDEDGCQNRFLARPSDAVPLVIDLADAMQHAHERGVVHRDIKPANVILEAERPVLLDFGMAHSSAASQCLTQEGDVVGTPAYMSPEQAAGQSWKSGAASDIYSLGVMLYQMVCGRLPFSGDTPSVLLQVLHQKPTPPRHWNRRVSRDLETIVLKCLEKDAADRYGSAQELAADLKRYARGAPILAKRPSIVKTTYRWALRKPALATLATACILLCVFLAGMATTLTHVATERDKAQTAENQTRGLLDQATFDAGVLALQRGEAANAAERFQSLLDRGFEAEFEARLKLIESHFILHRLQDCEQQCRLARDQRADATEEQIGQLALWDAELSLAGFGRTPESPATAIRQSLDLALPPSDRDYAKSLVAESTPDAISHLRLAIQTDPFHYRARRMLIVSLLSLGSFEASALELSIARQLFPESQDLQLLHALCSACVDGQDHSEAAIDAAGLADSEATRWRELCRFLRDLRSQPEVRFRKAMGSLSLQEMTRLLAEFTSNHLPIIASRQWHLPIGVGERLGRLLSERHHPTDSDPADVARIYRELAETHPESTILLVAAESELAAVDLVNSTQEQNLRHFESARIRFDEATRRSGFLRGDTDYAHFGLLSIAALERLKLQHEPTENDTRFRRLSSLVDVRLINRISAARLYGIAALQADDREQSRRWFRHQQELAIV
ncbi:MAG: serine/threonine-protein kinase, partial [Planctomycetota bacterium]